MVDRKNNTRVINPHDKLIRETFSIRDNARSFLTNYLPDRGPDPVDMSSLKIRKDSFIDKGLV